MSAPFPPWLRPHLDAAGGLLRFDRFMELALYDAGHGYYTARIPTLGRHGDFATSATLCDTLGRALAKQWSEPPKRHVIEIGAGTGKLTDGLRKSLPFLARLRTSFHIVERSPRLREIQQNLLGSRVHWHATMTDALRAANGSAFIFSNELVDAFPPRVFRPRDASWEELFLELGSDTLVETWQAAESLPDSGVFGGQWPDGQCLEVHESYRTWLAAWMPDWTGGQLITIDYGGSPVEIYHRRPAGSLRAHLHHQVFTGPEIYQHPGRQDLTADVNFDDLRDWSRQLKPDSTLSLCSQREFLVPHTRANDEERFLIEADGAGGAFKVLTQAHAGP